MSFKKFLLEQVSLGDYWDMLNKFDWHYEHSDDHRVYTQGRDGLAKLSQIAAFSDEHKELFNQFRSGGEKPVRP